MPLVGEVIHTNNELRELADREGKMECKVFETLLHSNLKKDVIELLDKKEGNWVYKIQELLNTEENIGVKNRDEELLIVEALCACFDKEERAGKSSLLYRCDTLQQMKEIYQIIIFYLTRIEFDFEEELYIGFVSFIKEWGLSPEYIAEVLKKSKCVKKAYVARQLAKILEIQGEQLYGEELLKCIREYEGNVA